MPLTTNIDRSDRADPNVDSSVQMSRGTKPVRSLRVKSEMAISRRGLQCKLLYTAHKNTWAMQRAADELNAYQWESSNYLNAAVLFFCAGKKKKEKCSILPGSIDLDHTRICKGAWKAGKLCCVRT